MAVTQSFDVTTGVDLQEVDNAINQARKEVTQRYDFKGKKAEIEYDRKEATITLLAQDEFYLEQMWAVIQGRFIGRKVPVKNMHRGTVEQASGGTVRQVVKMQQGLTQEIARSIVKVIKDAKFKKTQATIQADTVRVSSPSRDELQDVIALLKDQTYEVELKFENYRSQ